MLKEIEEEKTVREEEKAKIKRGRDDTDEK